MEQRLANRSALITGAADGIGLAMARRFAAEGARVMVADVNAAAAALPAWWQFKNVGTCRSTALTANFAENPQDVVCVDWAGGQQAGGIGAYSVGLQGANTATITGVVLDGGSADAPQ